MKPFGLKLNYSNIKLNALLFYDDRFTKTEIIVNGDKVYINYNHLYRLFTCFWEQFLQVYLDNCANKIVDKQIISYTNDLPLILRKITFWFC